MIYRQVSTGGKKKLPLLKFASRFLVLGNVSFTLGIVSSISRHLQSRLASIPKEINVHLARVSTRS